MFEDRAAEAQKVLDQLWNEQLIPFALTVGKLTKDATKHTIHFHDSRIRTAQIPLNEGQPFAEGVRAAVLERVARLSGPLANWHPEKATAAKIRS
jgi:hypothetical protein